MKVFQLPLKVLYLNQLETVWSTLHKWSKNAQILRTKDRVKMMSSFRSWQCNLVLKRYFHDQLELMNVNKVLKRVIENNHVLNLLFSRWKLLVGVKKITQQSRLEFKTFLMTQTKLKRILQENQQFSIKLLLTELHQFFFINFKALLKGFYIKLDTKSENSNIFLNVFNNVKVTQENIDKVDLIKYKSIELCLMFSLNEEDINWKKEKLFHFLHNNSKNINDFIESSKRLKKKTVRSQKIKLKLKALADLKSHEVDECTKRIAKVEKIEEKRRFASTLLARIKFSSPVKLDRSTIDL